MPQKREFTPEELINIKVITLKQNQFEELKRGENDVSELVERTDARGDRGNNGDCEGNDKLKKSYLVVKMYL